MNYDEFQKAETPAQKAVRLGVRLLPAQVTFVCTNEAVLAQQSNPIVAICGQCGLEIRQLMGYRCGRYGCPLR